MQMNDFISFKLNPIIVYIFNTQLTTYKIENNENFI